MSTLIGMTEDEAAEIKSAWDRGVAEAEAHPLDEKAIAAQAFFAELAAEVRKPHYGGPAREFTQSILLRAIERGLYTPEKP